MNPAQLQLPTLFVSHGSPMLAIDPGTTGAFFARLGPAIDATFGRPRAIVAISPHTAARVPVWLGGAQHHAIHDFSGFPKALYALQYSPPGAPELAQQAQALLAEQGLSSDRVNESGLDHGIWAVLRSAWPQADVPVLPLALVPHASPAEQWRLGQALAPLRDQGVLLMGTGSLTHNLGLLSRGADWRDDPSLPEHPACAEFRAWVQRHVSAEDWPALLDYRQRAPQAALMHPTDEHWLPFYVAAGAGAGLGVRSPAGCGIGDAAAALPPALGQRLHGSVTYGSVAMDAYGFGASAGALAQALGATPTD